MRPLATFSTKEHGYDLTVVVYGPRLKKCPECGKLFAAVRRQKFDTLKCSAVDRKRRFYNRRKEAKYGE